MPNISPQWPAIVKESLITHEVLRTCDNAKSTDVTGPTDIHICNLSVTDALIMRATMESARINMRVSVGPGGEQQRVRRHYFKHRPVIITGFTGLIHYSWSGQTASSQPRWTSCGTRSSRQRHRRRELRECEARDWSVSAVASAVSTPPI